MKILVTCCYVCDHDHYHVNTSQIETTNHELATSSISPTSFYDYDPDYNAWWFLTVIVLVVLTSSTDVVGCHSCLTPYALMTYVMTSWWCLTINQKKMMLLTMLCCSRKERHFFHWHDKCLHNYWVAVARQVVEYPECQICVGDWSWHGFFEIVVVLGRVAFLGIPLLGRMELLLVQYWWVVEGCSS